MTWGLVVFWCLSSTMCWPVWGTSGYSVEADCQSDGARIRVMNKAPDGFQQRFGDDKAVWISPSPWVADYRCVGMKTDRKTW